MSILSSPKDANQQSALHDTDLAGSQSCVNFIHTFNGISRQNIVNNTTFDLFSGDDTAKTGKRP